METTRKGQPVFVGTAEIGDATAYELVIFRLKGTELEGQWDSDTDLLMVCCIANARCCWCRANTHPSRLQEYLGIGYRDAENLAAWLEERFA